MIETSGYKKAMNDDLVTMVTKRGQTSVPSRLRRKAGLAALGFALRFQKGRAIRSDAAMKELREGEKA